MSNESPKQIQLEQEEKPVNTPEVSAQQEEKGPVEQTEDQALTNNAQPKRERTRSARPKNAKVYKVKSDEQEAEQEDATESTEKPSTANKRRRNKKKQEPKEESKEVVGDEKSKKTDKPRKEKPKKLAPTQYQPFISKQKFKSKYQEYMYGEWRRYRNSTFVILETHIPLLPTSNNQLQEPDDSEYLSKLVEIDEQIENLNESIQDKVKNFEEAKISMRDGQTGRGSISKELSAQLDEMKIWTQKKREILLKIERINKTIAEMDREKVTLLKQVHPIYNSLALLDKGVREIEKRMETSTLSRAEESRAIADITKIKNSKSILNKIDTIREQIQEKYDERKKDGEGLPEIKQVAAKIQKEIDFWRGKDKKFVDSKSEHSKHLDQIYSDRSGAQSKISGLKLKKNELKEAYYSDLIEYEVQQMFIKDITWLAQKKMEIMEREDRNTRYAAEKAERDEQRKRMKDERKRRDLEIKAAEDERRKIREEKQKVWEANQLSRFDEHPYRAEIDMCESLIYYCAKNRTDLKKQEITETPSGEQAEAELARKKAMEDKVKDGKLQFAPSKQERQEEQAQAFKNQNNKKDKKKREGPSVFYEDDNALNLDLPTIQKFSKLSVSPPTATDELPETQQQITTLRDALNLKGKKEQAEGRAHFTHDKSYVETDEYKSLDEELKKLDAKVEKQVGAIMRAKLDWSALDEEDGINVDEELDEDQVEARLARQRGGDRNRGGDRVRRDGDRSNRGRGDGERQNRGRGDGERQNRGRGDGERQNRGRGDGERQNRGRGDGDRPYRGRVDGDRPNRGQVDGDRPNRGRGDRARSSRRPQEYKDGGQDRQQARNNQEHKEGFSSRQEARINQNNRRGGKRDLEFVGTSTSPSGTRSGRGGRGRQ